MDPQWRNFTLVLAFAAVVATPVLGDGSETAKSIPDFSGVWLHTLPGFEPLPSGPTALINRSRRDNGTGDILKLNGDYTNPILKPQAAAIVKKHAQLGWTALAILTRATSAGRKACPSSLRTVRPNWCKTRTGSSFFTSTIIRSAMYG